MSPITLKKTFPPVKLTAEAREAIREFGHRHKAKIDAARLEDMAAKQAVEFCLTHAHEAWFTHWPAHLFRALELAADRNSEAIDTLELVLLPDFTAAEVSILITTHQSHPLPDTYFVDRVIAEAKTIKI